MTTPMHLAGTTNPLLPNATFFAVLLIFVIVMMVLWKVILPPINDALRKRSDMITQTTEDNRKAAGYLEAADARYNEALAEARAESAKIRDEAREEGRRQLDVTRERAQTEADEVRRQGLERLEAERDGVLEQMRSELGTFSGRIASRVVGAEVSTRNGGAP